VKRRDLLQGASVLGAAMGTNLIAGPGATWALAVDSGAAPGGTTPGDAKRAAASDRIRVGMIGVGGMGTGNLRDFKSNPDVDVVAVCDVDPLHLDAAVAQAGGKARAHKDYRRLLDDREIDAVVISTPEHWHALMSIDACLAGKDVYVEKPASHHIRDGRLMVDTARRNKRVVQVGSQQRSGAHFQRAVKYIQDGRIGDVHYAVCWNHSPPMAPKPVVTGGPPPGFEWDLWLGPAPKLAYDKVMNGMRRSSWDFWGGNLTEWGCHLADIVLWAMKLGAPESVVAAGGRFFRKDGDIPDTLQVSYKYPNFLFHYSILTPNTYGLNGDAGAARFGSFGIQFHGSKGTLYVDRSGFRLTPQPFRQEEPNQPPSPSSPDSKGTGFYYTTMLMPEVSDSSQQHGPHVRNFLDCVKSRNRPNADIELGHATNTTCRLGNIAYRTGRTIRWDAAKERVLDDAEANRLALGTYRDPWKPKGL
jgi:predicted dehydrogenase